MLMWKEVIIIKEIIIQGSYGIFNPDKQLLDLIKEYGYKSMWNIYARTDERIINFIKNNASFCNDDIITYSGGKKEGRIPGYIKIVKVDTLKPWIIDNYDGAESVRYIEVIDKDLNYCEMKHK